MNQWLLSNTSQEYFEFRKRSQVPTYLIHSLHPSTQNHSSDNTRRSSPSEELPPSILEGGFSVEDVFDDVKLGTDGGGLGSGAIALERCENFTCFIISAFPNQQTGRVREKRAHHPY